MKFNLVPLGYIHSLPPPTFRQDNNLSSNLSTQIHSFLMVFVSSLLKISMSCKILFNKFGMFFLPNLFNMLAINLGMNRYYYSFFPIASNYCPWIKLSLVLIQSCKSKNFIEAKDYKTIMIDIVSLNIITFSLIQANIFPF